MSVFKFVENSFGTRRVDYDTKVLIVDLGSVEPPYVALLRDLIQSDYQRIYQRLEEHLPQRQFQLSTFPIKNTNLNAQIHLIDRSGWLTKSNNVLRFMYKGDNYNFVVRDKIYTKEHYILAKRGNQELTQRTEVEAALLCCQLLGTSHEAVLNVTSPAEPVFHIQFIKQMTAIWDGSWPVSIRRESSSNLHDISNRTLNIVLQYSNKKTPCDLLFRWEKPNYHVAIIPRKPITKDRNGQFTTDTRKILSNAGVTRPFGGLEMAGFFPVGLNDKFRIKEINEFKRNPASFNSALQAFAA